MKYAFVIEIFTESKNLFSFWHEYFPLLMELNFSNKIGKYSRMTINRTRFFSVNFVYTFFTQIW